MTNVKEGRKTGHVPVRIQNCLARSFTHQGLHFYLSHCVGALHGSVHAGQGDDIEGTLDLVGRPNVPREAQTISVLCLVKVVHFLPQKAQMSIEAD